MSNNKYNIEEVFKSELEDFEMEVPKNGWSNISNNIANASKVAKTSFWGSTAFTIVTVGTSLAIATGAIVYSNLTTNEKETNIASEKEEKTKEITLTKVDKTTTNTITLTEETQSTPQTAIDPVIEETKKEKTRLTKQYIIKNKTSNNDIKELTEDENTPSIVAKKPIKPITITEGDNSKDIEIIEIEATETIASISASPIGGYAPLTVDFSHQNENASTRWNFKDGTSSNENKLSHTFEKEGQYEVELSIIDKAGNKASTTKTISVLANSKINKIPNIFTPNNDGINDNFIFTYENIESFNLYIYNKSGGLVFESNNIEKGWNGNTQYNEKAEAGNYIYMIKAKGTDGKNFEESGIIKLAR
jgi:gliding motility-associated-like protein